MAASEGVPLMLLEQYGGWEDEKTARIYAKFRPTHEHAAMMQAAFRRASGVEETPASPAVGDLAAALAALAPEDRAALLAQLGEPSAAVAA